MRRSSGAAALCMSFFEGFNIFNGYLFNDIQMKSLSYLAESLKIK